MASVERPGAPTLADETLPKAVSRTVIVTVTDSGASDDRATQALGSPNARFTSPARSRSGGGAAAGSGGAASALAPAGPVTRRPPCEPTKGSPSW